MTFSMLYNVTSSILRSIGDTLTPLCFLIGSTICNIVLDLLFIRTFHAGVKGAALATVISQLLSFLFCVIYMWIQSENNRQHLRLSYQEYLKRKGYLLRKIH